MTSEDPDRTQGLIQSYVHPGSRLAAMVEVVCEPPQGVDLARLDRMAHDLAMHVAAVAPLFHCRDDVPDDMIRDELDIARAAARRQGVDNQAQEAFMTEWFSRFHAQVCLMEQPYIKDMTQTIAELLEEWGRALGCALYIRRFARYQLGDTDGHGGRHRGVPRALSRRGLQAV